MQDAVQKSRELVHTDENSWKWWPWDRQSSKVNDTQQNISGLKNSLYKQNQLLIEQAKNTSSEEVKNRLNQMVKSNNKLYNQLDKSQQNLSNYKINRQLQQEKKQEQDDEKYTWTKWAKRKLNYD